MLTNTLKCHKIVTEYLQIAEDFFEGKSNDFIMNNKYSISEIMFMVGVFNLTDLLDKFINFEKLLKYYSSHNIFYFAMIGAIYQKHIKCDDSDITNIKTDIVTKLTNLGLDYNIYKDILKSNIKTNNKELFDLIKNVYSSS